MMTAMSRVLKCRTTTRTELVTNFLVNFCPCQLMTAMSHVLQLIKLCHPQALNLGLRNLISSDRPISIGLDIGYINPRLR